MAPRRNRKAELAAWREETSPRAIGDAEWAGLLERLAPVSESYLRRLLRATGLELSPLAEGVRQDSFEDLERTLLALEREYAAAEPAQARVLRRVVIQAKDHARLALGRGKSEKQEMILWMLTWLENPAAFPLWVRMRLRQSSPERAARSPE